jgi:hypothetical protein
LRDLLPEERDAATTLLAEGMLDTPLNIAAYGPDRERRERSLRRMFTAMFAVFDAQRPLAAFDDGCSSAWPGSRPWHLPGRAAAAPAVPTRPGGDWPRRCHQGREVAGRLGDPDPSCRAPASARWQSSPAFAVTASDPRAIRQLGEVLRHETPRFGLRLDTSGQTAAETVDEIFARAWD